ncbi:MULTISPECIES: hypothetical protein [unclassified Rhodococcus (in: high G+C Gram-positive bacteria)]|uniref:hypothetical protein n=1 Tax=unclassified Rhodococcus (in: high G+C Gram-positive bacteria) TaxID=192944 RepID=UPI0016397A2B|nr:MULTISPECIES: hypothetical protein [unclassified Rhodococcus (in: high G+C Gram-positive bacteria)]MBC2640739.1 hypothetical protein [Rhodococcus sp. 3A]MBC2894516.1 hypothetical protein [Rhodococcus sp. 4CII]
MIDTVLLVGAAVATAVTVGAVLRRLSGTGLALVSAATHPAPRVLPGAALSRRVVMAGAMSGLMNTVWEVAGCE